MSRWGSVGTIVAIFTYFAVTMPSVWLSGYNLINLLEQTVTIGLLAMGMTTVCAAGEMDLSVGSMLSLATVIVMSLAVAGRSVWLAIVITLFIGAVAGAFNGLLKTVARIPGVLPTISSQSIVAGIALVYTNGVAVYGAGPGVDAMCRLGRGITPGIVLVVGAALVSWFLGRTRYGRVIYMTGGNPEAARHSGVFVNRVVLSAYVACGVLAAASGVMLAGRIGSGSPIVGADFLLDAIIAVMIGSTVLTQEQEFTGPGSLVGAFFMTVVNSGMQISGQGYPAQCLLRAILFVVCLTLFSLQKRATE